MNAAQMQQMGHPGAVTPGPHVTQGGAMMAMQPGAMGGPAAMGGQHPGGQMGGMPAQMGAQSMAGGMPNAHALSHRREREAPRQEMDRAERHGNSQRHAGQRRLMRLRAYRREGTDIKVNFWFVRARNRGSTVSAFPGRPQKGVCSVIIVSVLTSWGLFHQST